MKRKISITINEKTIDNLEKLRKTETRSLSQMINLLVDEAIVKRAMQTPYEYNRLN